MNLDQILDLVEENSYSDLTYGKGRQNHFIMDEINSYLAKLLLNRKVIIDFEKEVDFIYSNTGSIVE